MVMVLPGMHDLKLKTNQHARGARECKDSLHYAKDDLRPIINQEMA